MAKNFDNTNSGILFKNKYKEHGDKKPDYTGFFTDENGKEWSLAGWHNKAGIGIRLSEKREKKEEHPTNDVDSEAF